MNDRHPWQLIAGVLVLAVVWISLFTQTGSASRDYQTVPTMPPPTATPTVTATAKPQNTPTNPPLPSATSPRIPNITSTETAIATPTKTALVATSTSTGTPLPMLPTLGAPTVLASPGNTATVVVVLPPTEAQPAIEGNSGHTWLYGLVGGGIILVGVIAVGVWIGLRRRR